MVVSIAPGTNEVRLSGTLDVSTVHDVRLALHAALNIYADTQDEKFYPPETLSRMVSAGDLGRKSGQGFYTYDER